jgi:hypothetical protein
MELILQPTGVRTNWVEIIPRASNETLFSVPDLASHELMGDIAKDVHLARNFGFVEPRQFARTYHCFAGLDELRDRANLWRHATVLDWQAAVDE